MLRDIAVAREAGADGVVFGLLRPDATVDLERTRRLVAAAKGMSVTFHRAFDWAAQPEAALEAIIAAGCHRVLTSGQAPDALTGAATPIRSGDMPRLHNTFDPQFGQKCVVKDRPLSVVKL